MINESLYIHLFNLWPKVSYRKLCLIKRLFGSFESGWRRGTVADFLRLGFGADEVNELVALRKRVDVSGERESLLERGIRLVSRNDDEYPFLLKQISNPPWLLYVRGAALVCEMDDIAIVGTRLPSRYGSEYAERIGEMVVGNGGRIVSGLAFGVDACAHQVAVKRSAPTVAVLASRVDSITPRSNTVLAERILETGGTIISEYAGAVDSFKYRFRERNRIIAGMCRATIVVEAGERSGASITAHHAFEQNRDVYALVGDIDKPQARGCLDLVGKSVAHPITDLKRLAESLGYDEVRGADFGKFSAEAAVILSLLNKVRWTEVESLCRGSSYDMATISSILTMMEMDGQVVGRSGKWRLVG